MADAPPLLADPAGAARWYLLVLDEVRWVGRPAVPGWRLDQAAREACRLDLSEALDAVAAGAVRPSAEGYARCRALFDPGEGGATRPSGFRRLLDAAHELVDSAVVYLGRCSDGLRRLLGQDLDGAGAVLASARAGRPAQGYAHYLSGLLHGLGGDLPAARESLAAAWVLERDPEVRRRVERARRLAGV